MKKVVRIMALILAFACLFSGTAFSTNTPEQTNVQVEESYDYVYNESNYENEFEPGKVLVGLKTNITDELAYEEMFTELNIDHIKVINMRLRTLLCITLREKTRQNVLDAIEILRYHPAVEYAEPNYIVSGFDPTEEIPAVTSAPQNVNSDSIFETNANIDLSGGVIPNDTYANCLWNIVYTEAFRAWNYTTGSSNVSVAVLDTGISPVADLTDNLDLESGINYINPNALPTDDNGHGTHVAGIIGAKGNNGIGVAGVCWNVNLVPFKVLDSTNNGSLQDLAEAITDAGEMGIPIINMSIEFNNDKNASFEDSIAGYDGLIVIAAGNWTLNLDNATKYPADFAEDYDNVIIVGSTSLYDSNELMSTFSNYGRNSVHLFAPGGAVYSTLKDGTVGEMSGTSMAAPMVTGTAALILSLYPNCTAEQLKNFIVGSAEPLNNLSTACTTGGRLNVKYALEYFRSIWGNGDINMDGSISNVDMIFFARYFDGLALLNEDQLLRADVNKDGSITEADKAALAALLVQ